MTDPSPDHTSAPKCYHAGAAVRVGPHEIHAAGTWYLLRSNKTGTLLPGSFADYDCVVPLTEHPRLPRGLRAEIVPLYLPDFGGVPDDWEELLERFLVPRLQADQKILVYCVGSHGRTGTVLASLIALLETVEETPDPIAAARERHCRHAVETQAQVAGIRALRR